MNIVLALHLHQPWRLARFRYLDLGTGRPYVDRELNLAIFRGIAERSYSPVLNRIVQLADRYPEFRISFSLSGTFVEQAQIASPGLLATIRGLVEKGQAAILDETYHHSLSFLLPPPELQEEVAMHREMVRRLLGAAPSVLRMTELAYSDDLGRFAAENGYRGMLAEGWSTLLKGRSPNQVFAANGAPLRLLLRNYTLSDDVAFRFSARDWSEYPLTPAKFARWIANSPGEIVSLFMDFETFGEHQSASTGILDFLAGLPRAMRTRPSVGWNTVEEAMNGPEPTEPASAPRVVTWADQSRDLTAWLGNDLQQSAFEAAKKLGALVRHSEDSEMLELWRPMLTSDHFYYMYVGARAADMAVHRYFNAYGSPYDAYANYMNALTDLRQRVARASAG